MNHNEASAAAAPSTTRPPEIAACFKELHKRDVEELHSILTTLWSFALAQPDDSEFATVSVFKGLANLIHKSVNDKKWLARGKNVYVPYYSAHIIGSYAMNKSHHAELAVISGVISPLLELMRGKISWVEQRVAVRALGHLATHRRTFESIVSSHEDEVVNLAMKISSTCVETVYKEFVSLTSEKRLKYQTELMTKGVGGIEAENHKAEEWTTQLQRWSLYLLNCFAVKNRSIRQICDKGFFKDLSGMMMMRGGVENHPGMGLIRSLCQTDHGRSCVSNSQHIVLSLSNLCRSSDYHIQFAAIEIVLLLLKDPHTRRKVIDNAVPCLADLVELRTRSGRGKIKVGDMITQVVLQDYRRIRFGEDRGALVSEECGKVLEEIWDLKVERRRSDTMMSEEEVRERKLVVKMLKQEGNQKFWSGEAEEAVKKYDEALRFCPLKLTKERIVLYSNRAQCYLLLKEADLAIRDTTRALCLSGPANPHAKSLWRRSQAYDIKGLARESLVDCSVFINKRSRSRSRRRMRVPHYAMRMVNKQMNATWLFNDVAAAKSTKEEEEEEEHKGLTPGTPAVRKEPSLKKESSWREYLLGIGKRRNSSLLMRHTCLDPITRY